MSATTSESTYLSPDQQDLLLAALTSNSSSSPMFNTPALSHHFSQSVSSQPTRGNSYDHADSSTPPSATLPNGTPLLGSELEFADWDPDFDVDGTWDYFGANEVNETAQSAQSSSDSVGESEVNKTNGASPTDTGNGGRKESEKRKDPPPPGENGSADPHDAEPKRRESDDKTTAKKPGRKPLTEAPTSKRKAQNRAAQRAFRERKEKHLRDLEQKVTDLEKASESANHENSLLRAQVDRLQTELREYRRRLQSAEIARSSSNLAAGLGGFQFDFPPFGTGLFGNQTTGGRNGSVGQKDKVNGLHIGTGSLMEKLNNVGTSDKRSPSTSVNGSSTSTSNFMKGLDSMHSTPRLATSSASASSPSASSVSQHGANSSCGTSPEPSNNSPTSLKPLNPINEESSPNGEQYVCKSGTLDGENETTFCEKLGMACGNPNNPIPKAPGHPVTTPSPSMDWLSHHQNDAFDPLLFNDYRDPLSAAGGLAGSGMSFFEDAFNTNFEGFGSPAPVAKDPVAACDAAVEGEEDEEEVMPADDMKQMLSCNKIWDRISSHPRFVSGELDMDNLCSELRSKAKCSEVGVVVAENDVREVLGKVGMSSEDVM